VSRASAWARTCGVATGLVASAALAAPGSWQVPERYPHARADHVVFSFEAADSSEVLLIGDFNHWEVGATPLQHTGGGIWEVALELPPGEYRYKFLVDGRARLDPSNPDEVEEEDGSVASRIRVLGDGRVSRSSFWQAQPRGSTGFAYRPPGHRDFSFSLTIGFERVDGTLFWLKPGFHPDEDFVPEMEASFGYGWESERINVEADFAQPLVPGRGVALGLHFTDGTSFQNPSEIGIGENTLSALFLKHDWIDYYDMQGLEPYLRVRLPAQTTVRLAYANEQYVSLTTQTNWSFFSAGADEFRPNPHLYLLADPEGFGGEGRLEAARFEIVRDSRRARQVGTIGFYGRGFLELGRGDFDYNKYILDGRSYMRLGRPVHLALRLRGGGRFGGTAIPSQKLFYLGGLGTVRGQSFFAQSGDHQVLGNLEYTFVIDRLEHGILLFYDAGTAWNSLTHDFDASVLLQSVGFGFKSLDDDFQVDLAWPVGSVTGQMEASVRLNRTF
jgi:hypothetical protein